MVISCCCKPATIAALMAIPERCNDRPAALQARSAAEDGGLSDLVVSREMPPLCGRGRRSRTSHCGAEVGERSERIVARDPPAKRPRWTWAEAALIAEHP